MASLFDLCGAEIVTQVASLLPANLETVTPTEIRELDWEDVALVQGVSVRYDLEDWKELTGTLQRDGYEYPFHIVICRQQRHKSDAVDIAVKRLKEDIHRYYHNNRRMQSVSDSGSSQLPCQVSEGPRPPHRLEGMIVDTLTVTVRFFESRT